MKKIFITIVIGFGIGLIIGGNVSAIIYQDFYKSLTIGLICGGIFAAMSLGFMIRELKSQVLTITAENKNPELPMSWYDDTIMEQIALMGFTQKEKSSEGIEIFEPRALMKVYEPNLYLEKTPYMIEVKASRLMIHLISENVEISPSNQSPKQKGYL